MFKKVSVMSKIAVYTSGHNFSKIVDTKMKLNVGQNK
jgi:hypothetical protein